MTTPMRSQYLALKKQYPDIILLFRLGDFYETFDDDARIVSSVCDVVLTSRPVGDGRARAAGRRALSRGRWLHRQADRGRLPGRHRRADRQRAAQGREARARGSCGAWSRRARWSSRRCCPRSGTTTSPRSCWRPNAAGLAYADISTGEFARCEISRSAADVAARGWPRN